MILAAVEREWRKNPDERLGQLLVNVSGVPRPNELFQIEDGDLLERLDPQGRTPAEQRYINEEPEYQRRAWLSFFSDLPELQRRLRGRLRGD
jgi:hypothetical protein